MTDALISGLLLKFVSSHSFIEVSCVYLNCVAMVQVLTPHTLMLKDVQLLLNSLLIFICILQYKFSGAFQKPGARSPSKNVANVPEFHSE